MAQALQARRLAVGDAIDYTPGSNVSAGAMIVVGSRLVGVACQAIASGVKGSLALRGEFAVVKKQEAFSAGDALYWDADGDPYNGTAGSGALTATSSAGPFAGWAIADAGETDEYVFTVLRAMESMAAESIGLSDLSDISGAMAYTAGRILIADGDSFEDQALTGPFNLSGAGLLSLDAATVAAAGSAQGDAAALADGITWVTGADGTKGVKLPAAAAGSLCIVKNDDTANAILKVYPNTDDTINALGANNAISMAAKTACIFASLDATAWFTVPLLPS